MRLNPQGARRLATGAAIAAIVSTVLVGVGVGVGTAQEGPAAAPASSESAPVQAPQAPAAEPTTQAPEPVTPESASAAPEPAAPEPAAPEPTAPESSAPESSSSPSTTPRAAPESGQDEPSRIGVPARSAAAPALVPGTPCTVTAKACVDLDGLRAWLIEDGAVRRGPVSVMIGDEIDPTPRGTFQVEWKAEAWTSREYLTQMPYSVFFAEGGIAFHEGRQDTNSAGCVKLVHADAVAWFEYLQVGDEVQIR